MSQWKMTAAHFRYLLEEVQDYRCAITGLPLLPENVWILPRIPRCNASQLGPENVYLVHESIAPLAREYSHDEIVAIAKAVLDFKMRQR